jgi:hypothetical protein
MKLCLFGLSMFSMFMTCLASAADLQVATYNAGLLKLGVKARLTKGSYNKGTVGWDPQWKGLSTDLTNGDARGPLAIGDMVGCVQARFEALRKDLFKDLQAPFVLTMQEVWSSKYQKGFAEEAAKHGYHTSKFAGPGTGVMVISSEPIKGQAFYPYSCDTFDVVNHRGVLVTKINFNGQDVFVIDTHTAYSTAHEVKACHTQQLKELAGIVKSYDKMGLVILGADINNGPDLHYKGETYSPVEKIWQPFWTQLDDRFNRFQPYLQDGRPAKTWSDNSKDGPGNPLVVNTAPLVAASNVTTAGAPGAWEEQSANLDQVIISKRMKVRGVARLIFDEKVNLPDCKGRYADKAGYTRLSDHYGIMTRVEVPEEAHHSDE